MKYPIFPERFFPEFLFDFRIILFLINLLLADFIGVDEI